MQPPPPLNLVLPTVYPVADKVKHHQVNQQADNGDVGDARPKLIQVKRAVARRAQSTKQFVKQRVQRQKQRYPEKTQPMDQRVQHIGANGGTVSHCFDGSPTLQRANHSQQKSDLQQAHQQPGSGLVTHFQQARLASGQHQGLHDGFKQRLLPVGKCVAKPIHNHYFAGLGVGALAWA